MKWCSDAKDVVNTVENENGIVTTYKVSAQYNPNFDYANLGLDNEQLTWDWAFVGQNDGADTILGNLMAGELADAEVIKVNTMKAPVAGATDVANDYNLNTSFSIEITVEQLDKEASVAVVPTV